MSALPFQFFLAGHLKGKNHTFVTDAIPKWVRQPVGGHLRGHVPCLAVPCRELLVPAFSQNISLGFSPPRAERFISFFFISPQASGFQMTLWYSDTVRFLITIGSYHTICNGNGSLPCIDVASISAVSLFSQRMKWIRIKINFSSISWLVRWYKFFISARM